MYAKDINRFYQTVKAKDIQEAKNMGDKLHHQFLQKKIQKKFSFEPGKGKDLIIKTPRKTISLQQYLREYHDCSPKFEKDKGFVYKYHGMGQKYIHYDEQVLDVNEHYNGGGYSVMHEVTHAIRHKEDMKIIERYPAAIAERARERNTWLAAIKELRAFKRNTGIHLYPEFDDSFTLYDYANIHLVTYVTQNALNDILTLGSDPLISKRSK